MQYSVIIKVLGLKDKRMNLFGLIVYFGDL
jgi:hypothetical protein